MRLIIVVGKVSDMTQIGCVLSMIVTFLTFFASSASASTMENPVFMRVFAVLEVVVRSIRSRRHKARRHCNEI